MMNKIDLVLPEDLKINELTRNFIVTGNGNCVFPGRLIDIPDRVPTMSEKDKEWLRNEMKDVPRDNNGRWI